MSFPRKLLDTYFNTFDYPFVRHHIDSYDQFLTQDIPAILRANNPFLLMKQLLHKKEGIYKYRVEVYIGGVSGTEIEIGTPTLIRKRMKFVFFFPMKQGSEISPMLPRYMLLYMSVSQLHQTL